MFLQTIYPMLAAGTDLSINIRRVNDRLSVAVMPRHAGVKDEAQQNLVPLILSGTAVELDAEFLQAIAAPSAEQPDCSPTSKHSNGRLQKPLRKAGRQRRRREGIQRGPGKTGENGETVEKDRRGGSGPQIFRSPDLAEAGTGTGPDRKTTGD